MPRLSFRMQKQLTHVWCWAAVSVSVDRYFDRGSEWRQCGLAKEVTKQPVCCTKPVPHDCVKPFFLEDALEIIGRLKGDPTSGPLSFKQIQHRINNDRPICARIGWRGGGGHFVVISGYRTHKGVRQVDIDDPQRKGASTIDYRTFVHKYRAVGRWTHTYPV